MLLRRPVLLVAVLLLASLLPIADEAEATQDDAGKGRDAGNSQGTALALQVSGFYRGLLLAGEDEDDWYSFTPPSSTTVAGRPVIEILLSSDPSGNANLELWKPSDFQEPSATGKGSSGARWIQFSADLDGEWTIHIFGTRTTRYSFTLAQGFENDGDLSPPRDAPDASIDEAIRLQGDLTKGALTRGNVTPGDSGDMFKIKIPDGHSIILAGLLAPRDGGIALSLVPPASRSTPPLPTSRTGPGFSTVYLTDAGAAEDWGLRIRSTIAGRGGPYTLMVRTYQKQPITSDPVTSPDAESGVDAPPSHEDAKPLTRSLNISRLTGTSPTGGGGEVFDYYKLPGVTAGRVVRVAASSFMDPLPPKTRPLLVLTLFDPLTNPKATQFVCGQSGGITYTASSSGTWFVRVAEASGISGQPCGTAQVGDREGFYAVVWDQQNQVDIGQTDAPAGHANAPNFPSVLISTGWMDRGDPLDTFRMGSATAGGVIRSAVFTTVAGLEFRLRVLDAGGVQVASASMSSDGAGRIYHVATSAGVHYLQIEKLVDATHSEDKEGSYRVSARLDVNEPPAPVNLNVPPDEDVRRTSVKLTWSEVPDGDFERYEVHRSTTAGFAPSSSTLATTVTSKSTTTATVTGLDPNTAYTFLVRTVDATSLSFDSNRVRVTTKTGPIGNRDPTLTGGTVEPASGPPGTEFTYKVIYKDEDSDPPTRRVVVIDGVPAEMAGAGTNYAAGVQFTYRKTFTAQGNHSFHFEFSDGEANVRDPEVTGEKPGPKVETPGNRAPTVTASASPQEGEAPLKVQFDADASDPDGDAISYSWDFDTSNGIQQDSNKKNPEHTYESEGDFTARVEARDSKGASGFSSVTIKVKPPSNRPPVAQPEAIPSSGVAPLNVQFDAHASDPDGSVVRYEWDFDSADGMQNEATSPRPTHTYVRAGSFVATVTVEDNNGKRAQGTVTVTVTTAENAPPSITISAAPPEGSAPLHVVFSAQVTDPNGDAVTVKWDFDTSDGIQQDAVGNTVEATYGTPGTYTVMAIATDAKGATATATTEVKVLSPTTSTGAVFIIAEPTDGKAPLKVQFDADTSQLRVPASSYLWDFGDGSPVDGSKNPEHTFSDPGTYTVSLTVTDQNGAQYQSTIDIVVSKKTPGPQMLGFALALVVALLIGTRRRSRE